MPFKDKEAQRKLMAERRAKAKRDNETQAKTPVIPAKTVIPPVIPTQADVDSGQAWVVLTGPYKGEIRLHGPLAQSWKHVPCKVVDGVCVADHGPDYHPAYPITTNDSNPITLFIQSPSSGMPNLERPQRIAGSLNKLSGEVRFGLDGPTMQEIGETIGHQVGEHPRPGKMR